MTLHFHQAVLLYYSNIHFIYNGKLKGLQAFGFKHVQLLVPVVFRPSSLEMIQLAADKPLIDNHDS